MDAREVALLGEGVAPRVVALGVAVGPDLRLLLLDLLDEERARVLALLPPRRRRADRPRDLLGPQAAALVLVAQAHEGPLPAHDARDDAAEAHGLVLRDGRADEVRGPRARGDRGAAVVRRVEGP